MEFRQTLLAAQRNQQQKSSESSYYKARFDPPKKEQKQKDRLSANIQKFLAKKDEEEKLKKLEVQKKREELLAMRDPKDLRKIQKTLKVIKSANKSVIADAVDTEHTAVTREGPDQPDQDDYGYESQEAAALYQKMMEKYSKIPDEPKFPKANKTVRKDLNGTRERVKHALQHEDDPVPHKRKRRTENGEREPSPPSKYEPEKKRDEKPEKPKVRKPMPPPMDFNQLLKLAEQKKKEPLEAAPKKVVTESEPDRLMTKKQRKEYEEEMARRQRRQERIDAEKSGNKRVQKEDRPIEREKKPESSGGLGRIPKVGEKSFNNHKNDSPKINDRERTEMERIEKLQKEKARLEKEKMEREKEWLDIERLEKLKAERERIEKDIERLNKDKERLEKSKLKLESNKSLERPRKPEDKLDRNKTSGSIKQDIQKSIDLKSHNTYRIDKNSNDKKIVIPSKNGDTKYINNHNSTGKPVPKSSKDNIAGLKDKIAVAKQKALLGEGSPKLNGHSRPENGKRLPESSKALPSKRPDDRKLLSSNTKTDPASKSKISNSFDFDKHVKSITGTSRKADGARQFPAGDVKRRPNPDKKKLKRPTVDSDSEYDSEMDDFIDDGDENMDYSKHIKEIFGYDKSKYRYMDDDDDPTMESSFARQQREEYISKKIGIMEDLEDMRMEAMEKQKSKKRRRISDD